MSIEPGNGYNFVSSDQGVSLNIDQPWTPPQGTGLILGFGVPRFPNPPLPPLPPDIPTTPTFPGLGGNEAKPVQFTCRMNALQIEGASVPVLQIAMGSVTYTHSLMPLISRAPFTDHRQAYMNFVSVLSPDVSPVPLDDANSPWMLGGGGYEITGTGRWYVTLSKWDAGNGEFDGGLLDQNLPWVSFVKADSTEFDYIFLDSGPSLYQNSMNVQKMSGYDAASTGFTNDWGNCHTTYFNPRFFGHHVRIIAVIDSISSPGFTVNVTELRAGGPTTGNEVQQIVFSGIYNTGTVTFTHDGTTTSTDFNPSTQFAYDLQLCLDTIPALSGNVYVQSIGPGVYQVEFTNDLRNAPIDNLVPNSSITSFANWYNVYQCSQGSQDIVIPCELNATSLMNKEGVTAAADPYTANSTTSPVKWANVVNYEDAYDANALGFIPAWATPVINDTIPRDFTKRILDYGMVDGCIAEPSAAHPFKVTHVSTASGMSTYHIQSGTVNNVIPGNIATDITVSTAAYDVWVKVPYLAGVFPDATGFAWAIGTPLPTDTDSEGYIKVATVNGATVTQLVTGSLWADRIKMGSATASYYFARV